MEGVFSENSSKPFSTYGSASELFNKGYSGYQGKTWGQRDAHNSENLNPNIRAHPQLFNRVKMIEFDAGDFIGADKIEFLQNKPTEQIRLNEVHQTSVAIVKSRSPLKRAAFFGNMTDDKFLEQQAASGAFNKKSVKNRMKRTLNAKIAT